jgi:hypothetical protein
MKLNEKPIYGIQISRFSPLSQAFNIVICGPIARECVDKHVSLEADSWRPTGTYFRVNE